MPGWRSAQPSRWWGYLACAWALLFAALHVYWALDGNAGLASSAGAELAAKRPLWFVLAGLWGVGLLLVAGAGLAIALTRRQRPGPLRRLVAAAGWAVSLLLLLRGVGLEILLLSGFYQNNTALTSSQVHWNLVPGIRGSSSAVWLSRWPVSPLVAAGGPCPHLEEHVLTVRLGTVRI